MSMSDWTSWRRLLRLPGTDVKRSVNDELEFHLEMRTRDLIAELNHEQAAAAAHGDGPLLIIAGAGTGIGGFGRTSQPRSGLGRGGAFRPSGRARPNGCAHRGLHVAGTEIVDDAPPQLHKVKLKRRQALQNVGQGLAQNRRTVTGPPAQNTFGQRHCDPAVFQHAHLQRERALPAQGQDPEAQTPAARPRPSGISPA